MSDSEDADYIFGLEKQYHKLEAERDHWRTLALGAKDMLVTITGECGCEGKCDCDLTLAKQALKLFEPEGLAEGNEKGGGER